MIRFSRNEENLNYFSRVWFWVFFGLDVDFWTVGTILMGFLIVALFILMLNLSAIPTCYFQLVRRVDLLDNRSDLLIRYLL